MPKTAYPLLDITAQWGRLNDTLIELVDYIPDDQLRWSPREDLWNFHGILTHVIITRDNWLGGFAKDGILPPDVFDTARSKEGVKQELARSWERMIRFLSEKDKVSAIYEGERGGQEYKLSGYWMAFHLLEHDIHHRADIFHYLALLNIKHPEVGTP